MKNSKYLIILLFTLFIACKSEYGDLTDKDNICRLYQQMDWDDQKYRVMLDSDFTEILDSIKASKGITEDIYDALSREEQREYARQARVITNKRPVNQVRFDSLMKLQKTVDNRNTELLLKIIKKNKGIPDIKTLPCKRGYAAVFMHADEKYFPELKILFEKEYKAGRVQDAEYNYMQWHFGGRKAGEFKNIKVVN